MPFKPMKRKDYEAWIGKRGWKLLKAGSGDYKLVDKTGKVIKPFLKITHPGGEVIAKHVQDTEKLMKMEDRL